MRILSEYSTILKEFDNTNAINYGIKNIGIFGSVARGEQTIESDIDICIESEPLSLLEMSKLKRELETLLNCKVDIVRFRNNMNPILKSRIEKDRVYV